MIPKVLAFVAGVAIGLTVTLGVATAIYSGRAEDARADYVCLIFDGDTTSSCFCTPDSEKVFCDTITNGMNNSSVMLAEREFDEIEREFDEIEREIYEDLYEDGRQKGKNKKSCSNSSWTTEQSAFWGAIYSGMFSAASGL